MDQLMLSVSFVVLITVTVSLLFLLGMMHPLLGAVFVLAAIKVTR